jgi:serine/threonine protein kinase
MTCRESTENDAQVSAKRARAHTIPDLADESLKKISASVNATNFEVLSLLGVGSQGRVYLVRLKDTQELYAMKVFKIERIVPYAKVQKISQKTALQLFFLINQ